MLFTELNPNLRLIMLANNISVPLSKILKNSNMSERLRHGMKFPEVSPGWGSTKVFPKIVDAKSRH